MLHFFSSFLEANRQSYDFSLLFAPGGHDSEVGNQVVSDAVISYLCQNRIVSQCGLPE